MYNAVVHGMGRLLAAFYDFIPNYGVGIIMLTILVRVAMIPLAVKQFHMMQANRANAEKMRKLLPEVKKIKEKYRDDRTRQYEEQKKLYEQHGVNMLGGLSGCLPVLVQMPVFMAMYSVLSGCNKIIGSGRRCTEGFHIPDGSALKAVILEGRDTFLGMNLNLQPSGVLQDQGLLEALPYYLLVAIMGYTMWYQTRQMMKAQPVVDPQMAQTQKIMQFMPLVIVFASLSFPAGLTVYWAATNIWSIAQQGVLLQRVGPPVEVKEKGEARPARSGTGLGSRLRSLANGAWTAGARGPAAKGSRPATKGGAGKGTSAKPSGAKTGPSKAAATKAAGTKASGTKAAGTKASPTKEGATKASPTKAGATKAAATRAGAKKAGATKAGTPPAGKEPPAAASVSPPEPAGSKDDESALMDGKVSTTASSDGDAGAPSAGQRKKPSRRAAGSQGGASAARKPAPSRARTGGQDARPKGSPAKSSGTRGSSTKPGGGGSGSSSSAGRPKGSGARKKGKGGHR